jgi:release factor glutamine methyltransferase
LTLGDATGQATATLTAAGIATAALDAELLLRHVTGLDRAALFVRSAQRLDAEAEQRYFALVEARAQRRPLQHLTGTQAFWRHDFLVTPEVLVPRPETELLVEHTLAALRDEPAPRVVDVGTGSGCIALSLAAERPEATVLATDISRAALAVAQANAGRLGLAGRVAFHEGDLLDPVAAEAPFHAVVSNPPYVDRAEADGLSPEVRDHEPALALFAPDEPYSVYRRLIPATARALRPGGFLLLEVGQGMADEVRRLCEAAGFAVERVALDLQGIPRAVVARRG